MANQLHHTRERIAFAIPRTLKSKLRQIAKQRQTDLTKLCTEFLAEGIAKHNRK